MTATSQMLWVADACLALGCLGLGLFLVASAITYLKLRQNYPRAREPRAPISVLKPLRGVDGGLYDNLRAVAEQDHPHFEILFGCEDADDPALDVARRIAFEFPSRQIRVVTGSVGHGLNPKVRLLQYLESLALYGTVLISDSNVRPGPDYLRRLQDAQVATGADLVHCLLAGSQGRTLGERLEDMQLSGWVAASVGFTSAVGDPVVIGKSMLMNRAALAEVGGLRGVEDILAEDYILGRRLREAGRRVALSPYVLQVMTSGRGVAGFWNRHVRWGQMQRTIAPAAFFASLVAQPTPLLLCASALGTPRQSAAALGLLGAKWSMELLLARRLGGSLSGVTALLLPLKDVMFLAIWSAALVKRTVRWRGHTMLVGAGSRLRPDPGAKRNQLKQPA